MWTFGRKIALGFAVSFVLLLVIGAVAYRSTETLTATSRWVDHTNVVLKNLANLKALLTEAETRQRGYLITGDAVTLDPYNVAVEAVPAVVKELRTLTADNHAQQDRLDEIEPLIAAKLGTLKRGIEARRADGASGTGMIAAVSEGRQLMDEIRKVVARMEGMEQDLLATRSNEAATMTAFSQATILYGTIACLVFVTLAGWLITRSLTVQIGSAVRHIQSSSAELQTAANQQAMGAKESSTSMNEIATTISELLATSRQIAESAQRVVSVAEQTAGAARAGEGTVQRTSDSIQTIRRQVDLVVNHMLELGKKSQQIGAVLEIVSELAEQTNILAINATIEAAGAGETGRRFAVVADEIRKLADRVGGSAKEIRLLIDDVRSAVNTTVMATETGSKAVDDGNRQFGDVTSSFKRIAELVLTTTDASREIELSTKQQSTAVEQVNVAIANVAQATRETEAICTQTLQTASQLAKLSRELHLLVTPDGVA